MHIGLWIALAVILILLLLYILYDQRKKIFKKKTKVNDVKEQKTEKKEIKQPEKNENISFERKQKQSAQEAVVEALQEDEKPDFEEPVRPLQTRDFDSRRGNLFRRRREMFRRTTKQTESIKDQIDNLSPEMKAIVFADLLNRKDEFKF